MEDYYSILECSPTATNQELRKSYQRLVLLHHPDKGQGHQNVTHDSHTGTIPQGQGQKSHSDTQTDGSEMFIKINKAWKILGDDNLRETYDARWTERCLAQEFPVQDEVSFSEFSVDEDAETGQNVYTYGCRCGGDYVLMDADVSFLMDLVCCESCSLTIRVTYSEES